MTEQNGFDDYDLERFLVLLDQRQLSPLTVKSLVWQFKKLKKERDMMYDLLTGDKQILIKENEELKKWNIQQRIYFDENAALRESLKGALWALEQFEKYGACSDGNLRSKVIKAKHGEVK